MGKKSKRRKNNNSCAGGGGKPSHSSIQSKKLQTEAARTSAASATRYEEEEETIDNLRFEDPYADEIIEDNDEEDTRKQEATELASSAAADGVMAVVAPNPYEMQEKDVEMEMSREAYKMHHALGCEWPSMTLDFLHDPWGEGRVKFPHQLLAVVGTSGAPRPKDHSIQILKLSDLGKMHHDGNDEEEEDEGAWDEDDEKDGDMSDDDDEDDIDYDPVLEHIIIPHYGGVNRLRVHENLIASWSDSGKVHLYQVNLDSLGMGRSGPFSMGKSYKRPIHTHSGHSTEGFAMDWSNTGSSNTPAGLATGDQDGNIHLWTSNSGSNSWTVTPTYTSSTSVEDIQWSPTEATVLATAHGGGLVKIYDTRAPGRHMLEHSVGVVEDVNTLAWNPLVSNLLATGHDDGSWGVWDLRKFPNGSSDASLARFTCHRTPITSLQWHPTDESMLVISDDVGSFVYDLSVEEEEDEANQHPFKKNNKNVIPPQLLFAHTGSPYTKEVRWHPQITSCLMSTSYDGFSVFIPSNL